MNRKFVCKSIIILTFGWLISSCGSEDFQTEEVKVAKVYNNILYLNEIVDLIPDNLDGEDSIDYANTVINNWVTEKLKLHKAEINLSQEQKDIDKELEEYRSSLLIYKYEQEYIRQKLDTNISDADIANYYKTYFSGFPLKKNVVIATLVVVPAEVESYNEFRSRLISGNKNYENKIAIFCEKYALKYNTFNDEWVYFNDILKQVPIEVENQDLDLKYKRYFEKKENGFYYLIYIHEYKLKGNIAPLNIVERDIVNILLNTRKLELLRELEENTFSDATNLKNIKIFKN